MMCSGIRNWFQYVLITNFRCLEDVVWCVVYRMGRGRKLNKYKINFKAINFLMCIMHWCYHSEVFSAHIKLVVSTLFTYIWAFIKVHIQVHNMRDAHVHVCMNLYSKQCIRFIVFISLWICIQRGIISLFVAFKQK